MGGSPLLTRCETLSAGTSTHLERVVLRGGGWRALRFPTTVAVLRHARAGVVLFDCGYHPRVLDATRRLPARLYPLLVPFEVRAEHAVTAQLAARGIAPEQVAHVVISHFHPDHIGGLRDFPRATFHASRAAYERVQGSGGLDRHRLAWFPELLPADFAGRVRWVDRFEDARFGAFPASHDLFGDGSLRLIPLPGHATGQLGLVASRPSGRAALFCADACWVSAGFRERRPPSRITRLIGDDPAAALETLGRLHATWRSEPGLDLIPAHCPEIDLGELL